MFRVSVCDLGPNCFRFRVLHLIGELKFEGGFMRVLRFEVEPFNTSGCGLI